MEEALWETTGIVRSANQNPHPPQLTVVDEYEKTSFSGLEGKEKPYLRQAGIDDITLNVRVPDPASQKMLDAYRMGRGRLGTPSSSGFQDLWAPHTAFWYPEYGVLSVEVKRERKARLVPAGEVRQCAQTMTGVLVDAGIIKAGDRPYSTGVMNCSRLDVAVDVVMPSAQYGVDLLRALERMSGWGGLYVDSVGAPGEKTVYHLRRSRTGKDRRVGRVYSRHREEPGTAPGLVVRFEKQQRFKPSVEARSLTGEMVAGVWVKHFFEMAPRRGKVKVRDREVILLQLVDRVAAGEITYRQAEQVCVYLQLEKLGLAGDMYPDRVIKDRRRLAKQLGIGIADLGSEDVEVDVGEVVALGVPQVAWSR